MSPLRALIVDDEPLARERLRALLRGEDGVEVIGECGSGQEAVAAIRRHRPDLVFLDMQMPGGGGLQVLGELPAEGRPAIVFATAHEQFAVDAFNVEAVDYLLKPFDRERLQQALRRVRAGGRGGVGKGSAPAAPGHRADRLAVKCDGRLVFLRAREVIWVEAADNYVVIHHSEGRLMVRETLAAIEERLGAGKFVRISRSSIVQLDQVAELRPTAHGDYIVVLRDGTRLPMGRSRRGQLGRFGPDLG